MDLELEDIIGYEGLYQINRAGQVWSVKRQIFLKPNVHRDGYYCVTIRKASKKEYPQIHRLLALQFLPNPLGLPKVDHVDRDKTNNSLDNLRWISSRGNNLNRTQKPISGEHNIRLTRSNTFQVTIRLNKKSHYKSFNTMEEAIAYRDNFIRENNLT